MKTKEDILNEIAWYESAIDDVLKKYTNDPDQLWLDLHHEYEIKCDILRWVLES